MNHDRARLTALMLETTSTITVAELYAEHMSKRVTDLLAKLYVMEQENEDLKTRIKELEAITSRDVYLTNAGTFRLGEK